MGRIEGGVGGRFKRGDIDTHMADALHCTVEAGTTLWSNYTLIRKKIIVKQVNFNEKNKPYCPFPVLSSRLCCPHKTVSKCWRFFVP